MQNVSVVVKHLVDKTEMFQYNIIKKRLWEYEE